MHSLLAAGVLLATALSTAAASPTTAFAADVPYSTPSVYLASSSELGDDTLEARDIRSPLQNRALNMEHMFQPLLDFDKDGVSSLALCRRLQEPKVAKTCICSSRRQNLTLIL